MDPPCDKCPKGSPDQEHLFRLSEANQKLVDLHSKLSTARKYGMDIQLSDRLKRSERLLSMLQLLDDINEEFDRARGREQMARVVAGVFR